MSERPNKPIDLDAIEEMWKAAQDGSWVPTAAKQRFLSTVWNTWPALRDELKEARATVERLEDEKVEALTEVACLELQVADLKQLDEYRQRSSFVNCCHGGADELERDMAMTMREARRLTFCAGDDDD